MDIMDIRRRVLMGEKKAEIWDYESFAQADGTIAPVNLTSLGIIQPKRGDTIVVAWDSTGYDGDESRILIHVNNTPSPDIIYEKDLTGTSGTLRIPVWTTSSTAVVTTLVSRSWTDRNGPRFKGNYIKIRLEKGAST